MALTAFEGMFFLQTGTAIRNNFDRVISKYLYQEIHGNKHIFLWTWSYEGVSKSFRTGRLMRELRMVQLSAI